MSRKKQAEKYKILYTPLRKSLGVMFIDPTIHVYRYNVAVVIGPPINDYAALAGFPDMTEAKAYRRKLIQNDRKQEEEA